MSRNHTKTIAAFLSLQANKRTIERAHTLNTMFYSDSCNFVEIFFSNSKFRSVKRDDDDACVVLDQQSCIVWHFKWKCSAREKFAFEQTIVSLCFRVHEHFWDLSSLAKTRRKKKWEWKCSRQRISPANRQKSITKRRRRSRFPCHWESAGRAHDKRCFTFSFSFCSIFSTPKVTSVLSRSNLKKTQSFER